MDAIHRGDSPVATSCVCCCFIVTSRSSVSSQPRRQLHYPRSTSTTTTTTTSCVTPLSPSVTVTRVMHAEMSVDTNGRLDDVLFDRRRPLPRLNVLISTPTSKDVTPPSPTVHAQHYSLQMPDQRLVPVSVSPRRRRYVPLSERQRSVSSDPIVTSTPPVSSSITRPVQLVSHARRVRPLVAASFPPIHSTVSPVVLAARGTPTLESAL